MLPSIPSNSKYGTQSRTLLVVVMLAFRFLFHTPVPMNIIGRPAAPTLAAYLQHGTTQQVQQAWQRGPQRACVGAPVALLQRRRWRSSWQMQAPPVWITAGTSALTAHLPQPRAGEGTSITPPTAELVHGIPARQQQQWQRGVCERGGRGLLPQRCRRGRGVAGEDGGSVPGP